MPSNRITQNSFFNGEPILAKNCLFNMIMGQRNVGKTFWCKKYWMIDGYLRGEGEFVYLRRRDVDIISSDLDKFLEDIREYYPEHDLGRSGKTFLIDGAPMGYAMSLSTAARKKSVPHPKVTKLFYDEFVPDDIYNGYLPNEIDAFFQLYLTLSRLQIIDGEYKMNEVICFFAANRVSDVSPYFYDPRFDVKVPELGHITKNGETLLANLDNKEISSLMQNQRIGKVLAKSTYGSFAFENSVLKDSTTFVEKISGNVRPAFNLFYHGDTYGVWISEQKGLYWVSPKTAPETKLTFSTTLDDHSKNTILFRNLNRAPQLETLLKYYKAGKVRFVNQKCKHVMYDLIRQSMGG